MIFQSLEESLSFINNLLGVVAIIIMIIIMALRLREFHEKTDNWDLVRLLMIIWFIGILYFNTWEFLYYNTPLQNNIPSSWISLDYNDFVVQSYSIPVVIVAGLYIVGYVNKWMILKVLPVILYAIVVVISLFFEPPFLFLYSMLFGYLIVLVFLLYTGFKLKDNGALGLAVFFLLTTVVGVTESYLKFILGIISYSFGIYFALGYFNIFKKKEESPK
jgi:hypothetical protein